MKRGRSQVPLEDMGSAAEHAPEGGLAAEHAPEGGLAAEHAPEGGLTARTDLFMQNRELSWLKFNERVLLEANRHETPLLERLKFISIFVSNLDEFFMIRVGSISDYALFDEKYFDNKTGMNAQEQLDKIFGVIPPLYKLYGQAFSSVISGLAHHGVELLRMQDLGKDDIKSLKNHFQQNVMPLLSPQIIDPKHPFPHLSNKQLHIAVTLEKRKGAVFGLIAMPPELDRLIFLDSKSCRFVLLEDLILHFVDLAFGIYKVVEKNIIAVTRNADINTEEELLDEDIDFREVMKDLLKRRQRLSPVRLELNHQASGEMFEFLRGKLVISPAQVFLSDAPLDLSFISALERAIDRETVKRLVWPAHIPAETLPLAKRGSMLKLAAGKDMLFSYPFESMSPLLGMIHEASQDPLVMSIKITLYRIDAHSELAGSLIRAAENGKEVIVLMELRARFDERNNIEWAQRLEEAGCRVIYGLVGYKVHSKICLITRRESGKIQYITQIGTGNYNEKTAKLYTDLSLITSNQEIGHDAAVFFGDMLLGNLEGEYRHLWVAPGSYKSNVLKCIEEERRKAAGGGSGSIIIKCNSLTDKEIIEKLAQASCAGVEISLIVRGICCLVPQIPGTTENIRVISIVGKFLEHTRVFCFGRGQDKSLYISSADLMTRNTQRRVEIACPILDAELKTRICGMLEIMLQDNTNAWDLQADGGYVLRRPPEDGSEENSQEIFTKDAREDALKSEADKSGSDKAAGAAPVSRMLRVIRRVFGKS